jgi:Domain of unknown function (DUF4115)
MQDRPLAALFAATDARRGRGAVAPTTIAIALVGVAAVTALVLSVWQLVDSPAMRTVTVTSSGRVLGSTATVTVREQVPGTAGIPMRESRASARARTTRLTLTAARGDCWLEVHEASRAGTLLFAGILAEGRSLRLVRKRVWLAFGAGGNLDVTLNGRRVKSFPTGTAAVTVTAHGVSPAVSSSPAGS